MYSIAIDGPAAAGKTTQARILAKTLGFTYVDTGALYRTIALHALKLKQELGKDISVKDVLNTVDIDIRRDKDGNQRMILWNEDVTGQIRTEEISKLASDMSALPEVRKYLLEKQRAMAREDNVVMEGRDIGTVILPDATCKIYLTADLTVRAQRRMKDLLAKGEAAEFMPLVELMRRRDYNDTHRAEAPLRQAEEAVLVDNTGLTIEETTEKILEIWRAVK